MSCEKFDPNCEGCRPVIVDGQTGKLMPPDSSIMLAVMRVWNKSTLEEQQAFWNVTVKNSRDRTDLFHMTAMNTRIEAEMKLSEN